MLCVIWLFVSQKIRKDYATTATTLDHEQEYTPINSRNKSLSPLSLAQPLSSSTFTFTPCGRYCVSAYLLPAGRSNGSTLQSLATFAIAFVARPIGSAFLVILAIALGVKRRWSPRCYDGDFDRGDWSAARLCHDWYFAPLLLALARFGQGLGLGGEGAARRCWRLKTPHRANVHCTLLPAAGRTDWLLLCQRHFLVLSWLLTDEQFMSWGWRVPFSSRRCWSLSACMFACRCMSRGV